jgi:hypothetical protein
MGLSLMKSLAFVKCAYLMYNMLLKILPFAYMQVLCQSRLWKAHHDYLTYVTAAAYMVISLTTAKFKPLVFSVSGFALSYTVNVFIFMILWLHVVCNNCYMRAIQKVTSCEMSVPHLLFWMALCSFLVFCTHYTTDFIVFPCWANSTISAPFLSQKTVAIRFLADNVCLNFYSLFGDNVCINCFHCSLVSTFTNEIQFWSPDILKMWSRNSSPSLLCHSKKFKAEVILWKTCDGR